MHSIKTCQRPWWQTRREWVTLDPPSPYVTLCTVSLSLTIHPLNPVALQLPYGYLCKPPMTLWDASFLLKALALTLTPTLTLTLALTLTLKVLTRIPLAWR